MLVCSLLDWFLFLLTFSSFTWFSKHESSVRWIFSLRSLSFYPWNRVFKGAEILNSAETHLVHDPIYRSGFSIKTFRFPLEPTTTPENKWGNLGQITLEGKWRRMMTCPQAMLVGLCWGVRWWEVTEGHLYRNKTGGRSLWREGEFLLKELQNISAEGGRRNGPFHPLPSLHIKYWDHCHLETQHAVNLHILCALERDVKLVVSFRSYVCVRGWQQRQEEGVRSPAARVTGSCKWSNVNARDLDALKEQQQPSVAELSLQPPVLPSRIGKEAKQKPSKIPLSSCCVGRLLLGMWPALQSGCIPGQTPLEKTNFPPVSSYQLKTASGIGMWTYVYFILPWNHIRPRRCGLYACCLSLRVHIALVLQSLESLIFLVFSVPLAFILLQPLLLQDSLKHSWIITELLEVSPASNYTTEL